MPEIGNFGILGVIIRSFLLKAPSSAGIIQGAAAILDEVELKSNKFYRVSQGIFLESKKVEVFWWFYSLVFSFFGGEGRGKECTSQLHSQPFITSFNVKCKRPLMVLFLAII